MHPRSKNIACSKDGKMKDIPLVPNAEATLTGHSESERFFRAEK